MPRNYPYENLRRRVEYESRALVEKLLTVPFQICQKLCRSFVSKQSRFSILTKPASQRYKVRAKLLQRRGRSRPEEWKVWNVVEILRWFVLCHLLIFWCLRTLLFIPNEKSVLTWTYYLDVFTDKDYLAADNYENNQKQISANNGSNTPKCTASPAEDNPKDPPAQNLQFIDNVAFNSQILSVSAQISAPSLSVEAATVSTPTTCSSANDPESNLNWSYANWVRKFE